jgi:predicted transglutaminase-like protease
LIDEAHPKVWEQGKEALNQWAKEQEWSHGEYSVESEFLEANFNYWLPKEEAYSVIVLLSSIVETQLGVVPWGETNS